MANLLEFPITRPDLRRFNEQKRLDNWHDAYWLAIHKRIIVDRENLRKNGQEARYLIVGVEEYKTIVNIFSRRNKNFTLPKDYCNIPIVLVPIENVCAVVPRSDVYWHEFVADDE